MGLRAKFNLALLAAFAIGLGLTALLSWHRILNDVRDQVVNEAQLIAAEAEAVRAYTVTEIEPLLAAQSKVRFLPHTIPAFSAVTTHREFTRRFPAYSYREAALNPTNPADKAAGDEVDIINRFRADPSLTSWIATRETPGGTVLSIASPEKISKKECLVCHSTPEAAPPSMTDIYGRENGFGWNVGETVGARIVSVPMDIALRRARDTFFTFIGGMTLILAVVMLLLNLMLHFAVIRPIRSIAARATDVSTGGSAEVEFPVRGHDEIASLAQSFNRMVRSVAAAMKMLEH